MFITCLGWIDSLSESPLMLSFLLSWANNATESMCKVGAIRPYNRVWTFFFRFFIDPIAESQKI